MQVSQDCFDPLFLKTRTVVAFIDTLIEAAMHDWSGDADSPCLDSDEIVSVRDSLIVKFGKHAPGTAPDGRVLNQTWYDCAHDFRLLPAA